MNDICTLADEALLDSLQRAAFDYFPLNTNPRNGLVADTSRERSPCSIAVVGFAFATYPVAVARGWFDRADAVQHVLAALRFFRDSDQSGSPTGTGFKGFYYHFLDMDTGVRVWQSELSMVDSALLIAGALTAAEYFDSNDGDERELRALVQELYRRIDWCWAQDCQPTMRMGWKPESGFLHYGWEGYSEAILMYALAMGSPSHPIPPDCYKSWTLTYQWENLYGHDCLYAGPLFVHQFSHAWIDFRGIRDRFMREKNSDYFENTRHAICIQREYAQRNPHQFKGYDANGWGLSACDGPTGAWLGVSGIMQSGLGYAARGAPYGPDDGTVSIPSALASLPFAPSLALQAVRNMLARYPHVLDAGRLTTGVNPTLADENGRAWISPGHYGLDQGIVTLMIENHRSEQIWQLMGICEPVRRGLHHAGFRGGWLQITAAEEEW
ncbi:MAG TPA: glucoamylase family protein [Rudaea sp.]|nr:glucoamylase family protein [Rudaea sp.]